MECMRALIENDRQVDGCFTTYHSALERSALKKDRYLHPPRRRSRSRAGGRARPRRGGAAPPRPPAAGSNRCSPRAKGNSLLAEKLKQAGAGSPQTGKLMPKTARDVPPPLELACLKALWTLAGRQREGRAADRGAVASAGVHHDHDRARPAGAQGQADAPQGGPRLRLFARRRRATPCGGRRCANCWTASSTGRRRSCCCSCAATPDCRAMRPPRAPVETDQRIDTVLL